MYILILQQKVYELLRIDYEKKRLKILTPNEFFINLKKLITRQKLH